MAEPFALRITRWFLLPPAWFKRLVSGAPILIGGRRVDPDMQYYCKLRGTRDSTHAPDNLAKARWVQDVIGSLAADRPPGVRTEDVRIEVAPGTTIGARVYRAETSQTPQPALVYFHGGGWTYGSLVSHDNLCRRICLLARCTVVSIEYRRAPEHPFPVPLDDSHAAYAWVVANAASLGLVPGRIAVGGDSAGGNLATALCARSLDRGEALPCFQWLLYPVTDLSRESASFEHYGTGLYLQRSDVRYFVHCYLDDAARAKDPEASPLLRAELRGMPPTHVVVAGFDVLCDEGRAYAARLRQAGVPVTEAFHDTLIHGFAQMTFAGPVPLRAVEEAIAVLRDALHVDDGP